VSRSIKDQIEGNVSLRRDEMTSIAIEVMDVIGAHVVDRAFLEGNHPAAPLLLLDQGKLVPCNYDGGICGLRLRNNEVNSILRRREYVSSPRKGAHPCPWHGTDALTRQQAT
jgi:hypothetical protein